MEQIARRIAIFLRALGAFQILVGSGAALAILFFVTPDLFEIVGEEIMMETLAIQIAAYLVMFSVFAAGVVSVFILRWGWILSFTVASFVLVMALLMGPATLPITKWSFLGLMFLSLVNWTAAVVYYYHDLYT